MRVRTLTSCGLIRPGAPQAGLLVVIGLALFCGYGSPLLAQTEIHRCVQADGTVSFQGMPCEDTSSGTSDEVEADSSSEERADTGTDIDDFFASPFDALDSGQADSVAIATPEQRPDVPVVDVDQLPGSNRSECEDTTRAAIDAIDRELALIDDPEGGRRYLDELLQLTEQLRACGQLTGSAESAL